MPQGSQGNALLICGHWGVVLFGLKCCKNVNTGNVIILIIILKNITAIEKLLHHGMCRGEKNDMLKWFHGNIHSL